MLRAKKKNNFGFYSNVWLNFSSKMWVHFQGSRLHILYSNAFSVMWCVLTTLVLVSKVNSLKTQSMLYKFLLNQP